MAVAFQLDFHGGTPEQYAEVVRRLDATHMFGGMAAGGGCHIATKVDGGLRIIDVWHSGAAMETFVAKALGPVLGEVGIAPPQVTPLHLLNWRK